VKEVAVLKPHVIIEPLPRAILQVFSLQLKGNNPSKEVPNADLSEVDISLVNFNDREHFSIINNISCRCIALLNNSFISPCHTNNFFGSKIFKPQKKTAENKFLLPLYTTIIVNV
jgi:hypothetical protein